ncbi:hypothetical protein B0T37_10580 [Chromobacterium violaceum]|uniref:hypothetical protein n=1 Tax=Chromobacterium violaceum TaxID=536 RepID=UPI0009DB4B9D|nr:hypothetical protein [Chromobacterium violaceum]MBX9267224.1 hypothetical protein [Chromobacterium violaceum]OQS10085.1 hypothetical protein B0T38_10975 [Chromobacterium violaceum]OQS26500.1 hypothetical protein B0T37_10580 [Chromobacterium violaceum]
MKWTQQGECLACGDWRIFRYALAAVPYYELWEWPQFLGRYTTAGAAKTEAERLMNERELNAA